MFRVVSAVADRRISKVADVADHYVTLKEIPNRKIPDMVHTYAKEKEDTDKIKENNNVFGTGSRRLSTGI